MGLRRSLKDNLCAHVGTRIRAFSRLQLPSQSEERRRKNYVQSRLGYRFAVGLWVHFSSRKHLWIATAFSIALGSSQNRVVVSRGVIDHEVHFRGSGQLSVRDFLFFTPTRGKAVDYPE
jgi:hypothetical protein